MYEELPFVLISFFETIKVVLLSFKLKLAFVQDPKSSLVCVNAIMGNKKNIARMFRMVLNVISDMNGTYIIYFIIAVNSSIYDNNTVLPIRTICTIAVNKNVVWSRV